MEHQQLKKNLLETAASACIKNSVKPFLTYVSAKEIFDCSGNATNVNDASVTFVTSAAMTCTCRVTSRPTSAAGFTFKANVIPKGGSSDVCVSPLSKPYHWVPGTTDNCANKYTQSVGVETRFTNIFVIIDVWFEDGVSTVVHLKGILVLRNESVH